MPNTSTPLNFNFLPIYADQRLGILPHTVEFYSFDDPAPVYGNQNFSYMLTFLMENADRRDVIYHGETAYWIDFDISVPLFLPLYSFGRVRDLRLIRSEEMKQGKKMRGQINFSSGWEWCYWLNDVIAARASWNPYPDASDDLTAVAWIMEDTLGPTFEVATKPLANFLTNFIQSQRDLLIFGIVNGTEPKAKNKLVGQGYIQGWDAWTEIASLTDAANIQPRKLFFHELLLLEHAKLSKIIPLLEVLSANFTLALEELVSLKPIIPQKARPFFLEMVDSLNITAQRALQVLHLYKYLNFTASRSSRLLALKRAQTAINSAKTIVRGREENYRVPIDRVAGWRYNPTCYNYGYLWPVHSLYFFWRDYGKATVESMEAFSPCYMNIINPVDDAIGEGVLFNLSQKLRLVLANSSVASISDCLGYPKTEPRYQYF